MWAWPWSRDNDNIIIIIIIIMFFSIKLTYATMSTIVKISNVQTAAMGQIPCSTERILVINYISIITAK